MSIPILSYQPSTLVLISYQSLSPCTAEGFDDLTTVVAQIDEKDLAAMGITKKGHIKKILILARQLNTSKVHDPITHRIALFSLMISSQSITL